MPELDGYQATEEIIKFFEEQKQEFNIPPIIACTALVGEEDKQKAFKVGMHDFINKPIDKDHLDEIMIKWIINK